MGDSLYVIVDGEISIHEGDRQLDRLGAREVFGEMALLDPAPRVASGTAVVPTRLLRLHQAPFQDLLLERPEVAVAIMRVLARRLRSRIQDLAPRAPALATGT
jgi:CRP/FNR family transcriptional regulator, cyclic AMP receptor protein